MNHLKQLPIICLLSLIFLPANCHNKKTTEPLPDIYRQQGEFIKSLPYFNPDSCVLLIRQNVPPQWQGAAYENLFLDGPEDSSIELGFEHLDSYEKNFPADSASAFAELWRGVLFSHLDEYDSAKICYQNAYEINLKLGSDNKAVDIQEKIATLHLNTGNMVKAIKSLLVAYNMATKLDSSQNVRKSAVASKIAMAYNQSTNWKKALDWNRRALSYVENEDIPEFRIKKVYIYSLYSMIYRKMNSPDSALYFSNKALDLHEKYQTINHKPELLNDIGQAYLLKKDCEIAMQYFQKAIQNVKGNIPRFQTIINENLALTFLCLGQLDSAEILFKPQLQSPSPFDNYRTYRSLSEVYAKKESYQLAYENLEACFSIRDKFYDVEKIQQVGAANAELELDLETAEAEVKIAKAEGLQNVYLSLFGGALFILLLVIYFYRRIQTAKKETEIQKNLVEQSLIEKEVLLKEIHHRVKNNLQIISSLLDEQARKASDNQVKKLMKEGQDRVQSMALIHQNLYESDNLSGIDIKAYLVELTKNISHSQDAQKEVEIELNVDDSKLDIDTAIPIGLILNELITNSFKYAFKGKDLGKISIDFNKTSGKDFLVKVTDNGIGLPADFDIRKAKSLGLNLVRGLVRQLEGTMNFAGTNEGTNFELRFSTNT